MKTLTTILCITVVCFLMAIPVSAQIGKKNKTRIGCVDIEEVFIKSPWYKDIKNDLKKYRENLNNEKVLLEEEVYLLEKSFASNILFMTEDEISSKSNSINNKKNEYIQLVSNMNTRLKVEEESLLEEPIKKIREAVQEIAIAYGYTIIIDKSTYVVWVDEKDDITKEVIKHLEWKARRAHSN